MWTIKQTHPNGAVSVCDGDKYIALFSEEADAIRACVAVNSDEAKVRALVDVRKWLCTKVVFPTFIQEAVYAALAKSGGRSGRPQSH